MDLQQKDNPLHDFSFQNPIIETGADPWIIQKDGTYYYCYSDNKTSIFVSEASNPIDFDKSEKKRVWAAPPRKPYSHQTWAPELHNLDGRWYIYFAASDGRNHTHRMFVLEADEPMGPYRFKGQITPTTDRWGIDGTILEGGDGHRYYVWSGWDGRSNIQQNLYIARMKNPWTLVSDRSTPVTVRKLRARRGEGAVDPRAALPTLEVHTPRSGWYALEITHSCESAGMHQLEINAATHHALHYPPTGLNNLQTHFEKIWLKKGRNILRLAPGIGTVQLGAIAVKRYGYDRLPISTPEFAWEKLGGPPYINEGPTVLQRNGRTHLVYSASGSWTDDYQLGLLTFQGGDLLDRKNWKKMGPVFRKTEQVFGPGHASFLRFADTDWIVYHAAKHSCAGWNRDVRMQPFTWCHDDNPVFGSPLPVTVPFSRQSGDLYSMLSDKKGA